MRRKIFREGVLYLMILGWPVILLFQLGVRETFEAFLHQDFWISFGSIAFLATGTVGALVACGYGYNRFCRWFDRRVETVRAETMERIALRQGKLAWPTSDPLHDRELDA